MKRKTFLFLFLAVVMAMFATTAFAAVSPDMARGSTPVSWERALITERGSAYAQGYKGDYDDATVFVSTDSAYNFTGYGLDIYIFDRTDWAVAASWDNYTEWVLVNHKYRTDVEYDYGHAIQGHEYSLSLRLPDGCNVTGVYCSGVFYP